MGFPEIASILFGLALLAGFVDAIAGGGGLITIPALLWAGLSPLESLATNKAQAVFGSGSATVHFIRKGMIEPRKAAFTVACTFVGATLGALLVQQIDSAALQRLIPGLLIGFALYFLFSPRVSDLDSHQRLRTPAFAMTVGVGVGFYDGFFGPGTGTFFAMGYVALLGYNLRRATAHTKLLNFTSNLAALIFFVIGGQVIWTLAAAMAMGQLIGAWLGSHLVLKHGAVLVRPILVGASILISLKLFWDQLNGI
ncbi:MAG: TSUP family transporter [Thiocapsa sp.]|nr:TSUP family transporter [Thiocapsa sp.]MCG6898260.1 TSUP family transporter [Thiocapsa sp.]MCG6984386.1 TSUP family transporter [Thiocapsa sp.]